MAQTIGRTLLYLFFAGVGPCLLGGPARPVLPEAEAAPDRDSARTASERTVFLSCGLSAEDLITLSTNLAASSSRATLLVNSVTAAPQLKPFLQRFRPQRVIPVGPSCNPK